MKPKTGFYQSIKKSVMAAYMALALAVSALSPTTSMAGPADDPMLATTPVGPGQGPGGGETSAPAQPVYVYPHYFDLGVTNQIVTPVDKYTYEQMEQDMIALSNRYPGRVTIGSLGQSHDGRNIYDFIIGNPGASKKVLFQGAIHAREYITVPLMMQQIEYLLAYYDSGYFQDKAISSLLNNVAIHFVPMANPDGVALSQFGEGAIRSPELRQIIQTCYAMDVAEGRTSYSYDQYLTRWKSNASGVDINHNFDAGWAGLNPTLNHFSSSDFKGVAPLSEPEAQALNNLTLQNNFAAVINYHSMGRVIYWDTANNQQTSKSLGMAQAVAAVSGYQILGSKGIGGLKDWLQQRSNSVPGITIEIGRSAAPVPFSEYPDIWMQNKAVPAVILDYVLTH